MKDIVIDGKKYQKATKVAEDLGYTSDYVGQLCRGGKVDAQQVGRSWYVVPESIQSYKKTRYRSNQVKSKAAVAEYKEAQERNIQTAKVKNAPRHIFVQHYEHDSSELIPSSNTQQETTEQPRQLEVEATKEHRRYEPVDKEAVKFTGSLEVSAVETASVARPADSVTEPKTSVSTTPRGAGGTTAVSMARRSAVPVHQVGTTDVDVTVTRRPTRVRRRWLPRLLWRLLQVGLVCGLVITAMGLRVDYHYDGTSVTESISFDYEEIRDYFNTYIVILFKQEY